MKFIFALSALAALVVAQDLNSLPDCGKQCVNNMLAKAGDFKCAPTDAKCLCGNVDFGNGLRDCSLQACGAAVSGQVVAFGQQYCASAGAGGAGTTTTTTTGASSSSSSGAGAGASSSAGSVASSASSAASSVAASASSSASSAAASASSKASSAAGGATSSSSAGFAMKTQAPLAAAGVLGLAALLV